MSIAAGTAYQFIRDQVTGLHDLENDVIKIALFNTLANLNRTTIDTYSTTNECVGSGYTAGGKTLTVTTTYSAGSLPFVDFADVTWTGLDLGLSSAVQAVQGALVYNTTRSNKVVTVINFGTNIVLPSSDFTIIWPVPAPSTAYLIGAV